MMDYILQAQLVDLKSELTETQAEKAVLEKEVHDQLLQLHAVQLQLHAKTGQSVDSGAIKAKLVSMQARMEDYIILFLLLVEVLPWKVLVNWLQIFTLKMLERVKFSFLNNIYRWLLATIKININNIRVMNRNLRSCSYIKHL